MNIACGKVILTGMNGTVAPAVAAALGRAGVPGVAWDRSRVSPDDSPAMEEFLRSENPDWLLHIATGPPQWAGELARLARELKIRFLFTSSVSVFSGRPPGDARSPYRPDQDAPDATDEYGRYKAECEARVREANPDALIARLGWQIGNTPGSNTMLDFLHRMAGEHSGRIEASRRWYPSCAFLEDTADALLALMADARQYPSGTYHLNANPAYCFAEIAEALRALHRAPWTIVPTDDFARDDRMEDPRVKIHSIAERLELAPR